MIFFSITDQVIVSFVLLHSSLSSSSQPIVLRTPTIHHGERLERSLDSDVSVFVKDASATETKASIVPRDSRANQRSSLDEVHQSNGQFFQNNKDSNSFHEFPNLISAQNLNLPTAFVHRTFGELNSHSGFINKPKENQNHQVPNLHSPRVITKSQEVKFAHNPIKEDKSIVKNILPSKDFVTFQRHSFNSDDNNIGNQGPLFLKEHDLFQKGVPFFDNIANNPKNSPQRNIFKLPIQQHFSSLPQRIISRENSDNKNQDITQIPFIVDHKNRGQNKGVNFNVGHPEPGNANIPIQVLNLDSDHRHFKQLNGGQLNKDQLLSNIAGQNFNSQSFLTLSQTFPKPQKKENIPSPTKLVSVSDSTESSPSFQKDKTHFSDSQHQDFGKGFVLRLEPSLVLNNVPVSKDISQDFFAPTRHFHESASTLKLLNQISPIPSISSTEKSEQTKVNDINEISKARPHHSLGSSEQKEESKIITAEKIDFSPSFLGMSLEPRESNAVPEGRSLGGNNLPLHQNLGFSPGRWESGFLPSNYFSFLNYEV